MDAADQLTRQLDSSLNARGHRGVFKAVLTLLAEGTPVPKAAVASALGLIETDVARLLAEIPALELDEAGHVVGAGLSLRPTPHRLEMGGKQLYAWCAFDTLLFQHL